MIASYATHSPGLYLCSRRAQLLPDEGHGVIHVSAPAPQHLHGERFEREGQLAIGAASVFYSGILDEIEKNDYDVFNRRACLSAWGKVSRLFELTWKL